MADPSGFLSNPPTTVVKLHGLARADMNGTLGIAVQYNADKGRYTVHMVSTQTMVSLKPENLIKAGMLDSYKAQFEQLSRDPRVKRDVSRMYTRMQSYLPPGVKVEYAGVGLLALLCLCIYFFGISKVFTLLSMLLLVGVVAGPDLVAGVDFKTMATRFPMRCREAIEQSFPFLRGKINNNGAVVIFGVMILLSLRLLLATPVKQQAAKLAAASQAADPLSPPQESDPNDFISTNEPPPPPPTQKKGFGISQALSVFYLYRTAQQLGTDPTTGFSPQLLLANIQTMPVWQMAVLGFSFYNLVKGFI